MSEEGDAIEALRILNAVSNQISQDYPQLAPFLPHWKAKIEEHADAQTNAQQNQQQAAPVEPQSPPGDQTPAS